MNIATVQVVLQSRSDDDEVQRSSRICLTGTEDGLMLSVFGKTFPVKDQSKFRSWYVNLCQIECVNYVILNVMDTDGNQVYESLNDLSDISMLRKTAEGNNSKANSDDDDDDWDYVPDLVLMWYYANSIAPFLEEVKNTISYLKKINEIQGLECPVLNETLTEKNARKFSKCSHWICQNALDGIIKASTGQIKCPLCRQEHYRTDIESI